MVGLEENLGGQNRDNTNMAPKGPLEAVGVHRQVGEDLDHGLELALVDVEVTVVVGGGVLGAALGAYPHEAGGHGLGEVGEVFTA